MKGNSSAPYQRIPDEISLVLEEPDTTQVVAVDSLLSRFDIFTCLLLVVFILSGVCMPLLIVLITANGGAEPTTFLVTLPGSLGMIFGVFLNPSEERKEKGKVIWKIVIGIALLEFFSQVIILDGLMLAGSSVYTVAYSSVIIYTALFSYFIVQRSLCLPQWIGILFVMIGLAIVSLDAQSDGPDVLVGFLLVLLGSLSHSLTYVGSEFLLTLSSDPIRPEYLSFLLGVIGSSFNLTWQMIYTLPRAQTLIVDNIISHHGSISTIVISYLLVVLASCAHSFTFYYLLMKVGSITVGLCKGAQSVVVFVASHFAFCSLQKSQCFTKGKGISLVVVLFGVTIYSVYSSPHTPLITNNIKTEDQPAFNIFSVKRHVSVEEDLQSLPYQSVSIH
jgi:drug/metabolite transporter (DMT)-like permease